MVKRSEGQLIYTVQFHLEKSFEDWNKSRTRWEHPNDSRDGRHAFRELPDPRTRLMWQPTRSQVLTTQTLATAARELAARDETLAGIFTTHGTPPLWRRTTGFPTLVHIILEQQVSLRSGKAMFDRLNAAIQPFAPDQFVEHGENYLRSLGVTRQKAAYLVHLSTLLVSGELNLAKLSQDERRDARTVADASQRYRIVERRCLPVDGNASRRHLAGGRSGAGCCS